MFKKIKKTLASLVLASAMAVSAVPAKAATEKDVLSYAPSHIQWALDNKVEAQAMVLGSNVLLGCLKSGIGSYIHDNGFWSGCAKGSLAGAVMFTGEYIAAYNEYPMVGAAGKLVHDLGISVSDNVMRGEPMFSQYETELGPVTLTFNGGIVPDVSFTLTPAIGIVASLAEGQRFDAKRSLYNLTPIFEMQLQHMDLSGVAVLNPGYTRGNVISYSKFTREDISFYKELNRMVLSHEFNHALFFSKWRFCKDLLLWMPTEKVHPALEMEKVQRWWNIGQDISSNLIYLPMYIDSGSYFYMIPEMEAYSMERM